MHYLIFYKGEYVAYADNKKVMKDFVKMVNDKDNLSVDKIKHMSEEILDHMDIMDNALYHEPLTNVPVSENILEAISNEVEERTRYLVGFYDRIYMKMEYFKLADEEQIVLEKFFDMYNDILQDCEYLYTEYYNLPRVINDFILPSLKQHHI